MPRKWGPCAEPGCPTLVDTTYCAEHRPAPWGTSDRRSRLPTDWDRRRRIVFSMHGRLCYVCGAPATQVDHVVAGDDHDVANLAPICTDCHLSKSGHEGGTTQGRYT